MDLLLIIVGIAMVFVAMKQRGADAKKTGVGGCLLAIGIVVTFFGVLWFSAAFISGFLRAQGH